MGAPTDPFRNFGPDDTAPVLHASAVAWDGLGCMILGPSGSGKSALALQLMAFGCDLIGDDALQVTRLGDDLILNPMPAISGKIEARGMGLLSARYVTNIPCAFAVDLSHPSEDRLPKYETVSFLGVNLRYIPTISDDRNAPAILQILKSQKRNND